MMIMAGGLVITTSCVVWNRRAYRTASRPGSSVSTRISYETGVLVYRNPTTNAARSHPSIGGVSTSSTWGRPMKWTKLGVYVINEDYGPTAARDGQLVVPGMTGKSVQSIHGFYSVSHQLRPT